MFASFLIAKMCLLEVCTDYENILEVEVMK